MGVRGLRGQRRPGHVHRTPRAHAHVHVDRAQQEHPLRHRRDRLAQPGPLQRDQGLHRGRPRRRGLPDFAEVHGSWAVDRVTWDDGAKIYFTNGGWATIRFSGTEPVLRVFAEMEHLEDAEAVAATIADHLGLEG